MAVVEVGPVLVFMVLRFVHVLVDVTEPRGLPPMEMFVVTVVVGVLVGVPIGLVFVGVSVLVEEQSSDGPSDQNCGAALD